jgi:hypothetical protein
VAARIGGFDAVVVDFSQRESSGHRLQVVAWRGEVAEEAAVT